MAGFLSAVEVVKALLPAESSGTLGTVAVGDDVINEAGDTKVVTAVIKSDMSGADVISVTPSAGAAFSGHESQKIKADGRFIALRDLTVGMELGDVGSGVLVQGLDIIVDQEDSFYTVMTDDGSGSNTMRVQSSFIAMLPELLNAF